MRHLILFVTLLLCTSVTPLLASEDFYSQFKVDYIFDEKGLSTVNQKISLTNKKSGIYASSYQLMLQGIEPQNISGWDSAGPLKIATSQSDEDTTLVKIDFNDQVVGINNTLNFTLNYQSSPADHNGQVWEISLPRLSNIETIDEYFLRLVVPETFGQLAFISPSPAVSSNHSYEFTRDQVGHVGVVAAFGNFQTWDFSLEYNLANPNPIPAQAQVSLPADTNYQRVAYTAIDPAPTNVEVDAEGNWLGTFNLGPQQNMTVKARGQTHLLAEPTRTLPTLTNDQKQLYLQPTAYWPSDDAQIKDLARKLKTAKNIYGYVMQNLKYDSDRARPGAVRKGGASALQTPDSSICTEFTDLFITLARAAGVPAREVNGFAYTTDKRLRPLSLKGDVFHAWPQYWDDRRQNWISVDPTWGNTTGGIDYFNKLDFNHFALVTRGLSDTSPAITSQNVKVKYGAYIESPPATPSLFWQPPRAIWPIVANRSTLTITNPTGQAIYKLPVTVSSPNLTSSYLGPAEIDIMPPYASRSYPVNLLSQFWPNFHPKSLEVTAGQTTQSYNIGERLFLPWQIILGILIACVATILGLASIKAWGLYLQKRRRDSPLRGQS